MPKYQGIQDIHISVPSDRNPDILADLGQVFGFTRPVFLDWSGVVYLTAYAYSVSS